MDDQIDIVGVTQKPGDAARGFSDAADIGVKLAGDETGSGAHRLGQL